MKKLSTVNVLEIVEGTPAQLVSFEDTKEGNEMAEELFGNLMIENGGSLLDIEIAIEDGEFSSGTYSVFIIHST